MDDDGTAGTPLGDDPRMQALEARLKAAREREQARDRPAGSPGDAQYRAGSKVLADLLGGVMGGLFLGWVIDQFAGTRPWGLLVMLFAGIGVAFRNIVRNSGQG